MCTTLRKKFIQIKTNNDLHEEWLQEKLSKFHSIDRASNEQYSHSSNNGALATWRNKLTYTDFPPVQIHKNKGKNTIKCLNK